MGRLATLALTLLLAAAVGAADHPFAGDKLVLKDPPSGPARRTFKVKATKDPALDPAAGASPLAAGATLEIVGRGAGDGTSGIVSLDTLHWVGLGEPPGARGYKWLDKTIPAGVRKVLFKPGSNGGSLTITGKGSGWSYAIPQPQVGPIDVRFTTGGGSDVWCAHFDASTFDDNLTGKLKAKLASAPPDCAVPPPPTCGNGSIEGTEECDDGGTSNGDGCSSACELEDTSAVCDGIATVTGTGLAAQLVASSLAKPVFVTSPPLDPRRVFIVEQFGHVKLVKDGTLLPGDFLDIHTKVTTPGCFAEQGLLGLAFDPDYEANGFFYVNYTNGSGDTVISRYHVPGDPKTSDVADDTSEVILRTYDQPFSNHNGGNLQFGPDGMLYAGLGDGGSGCDPDERAQNDASPLGKMMRIDPTMTPADPLDEVVAKGLRNPWRYSFDRATGDLYIGDVGQNNIEEIDVVAAPVPTGLNYGWDFYEGDQCANPLSCPGDQTCPASTTGFTMPIVVYDHSEGCSVTGGYVYRGCRMPDLQGTYFYADYCSAFVRTFVFSGGAATSQDERTDLGALSSISSFGEDARGELYVAVHPDCPNQNSGAVYKLVPGP